MKVGLRPIEMRVEDEAEERARLQARWAGSTGRARCLGDLHARDNDPCVCAALDSVCDARVAVDFKDRRCLRLPRALPLPGPAQRRAGKGGAKRGPTPTLRSPSTTKPLLAPLKCSPRTPILPTHSFEVRLPPSAPQAPCRPPPANRPSAQNRPSTTFPRSNL